MIQSPSSTDLFKQVEIHRKKREAILSSLRSGVVPHIGLEYIQVGRYHETQALLKDLDTISDGGASVRFILGQYGSGKTFFLNLIKTLAVEKKLVVVNADITNDHRLCGAGGKGRALYAHLMKNMSTRSSREGGALDSILENFISSLNNEENDKDSINSSLQYKIKKRITNICTQVNAYDFASILNIYYLAYQSNNDYRKNNVLRWLRAGFTTKSEANAELGVKSTIDDHNIIDYLKLMAHFVRMAGYKGLIVNIDEMGVLTNNLSSTIARKANYEIILRIVNDCLQGDAESIGFIFAGVDEFIDDPKRGLYSYEALASRLERNPYLRDGLINYSGPVIRLKNLTPDEIHLLLYRIRFVFAGGDPQKYIVPDEAITTFMARSNNTLGSEYYRTPREAVKSFVSFLDLVDQNKDVPWNDILKNVKIEKTPLEESTPTPLDDDDFTSFHL